MKNLKKQSDQYIHDEITDVLIPGNLLHETTAGYVIRMFDW